MAVRGVWLAVTAVAAMGAMPVPGQVTPTPSVDGPDIVVIARKLRKVRINYLLRGPHVRTCEIERSSGDDRIDRIMCAILRSCVAAGHRDVEPAKACMMARIDMLEDSAADTRMAALDSGPAPAPPLPQPTASQPTATPRPDGPDIVVTGQGEPDIVVTGSNPTMRGGLWRFRRTATLNFGGGTGARPANFTQCLPPGAIEAMLRRAASEGNAMPQSMHCGNLRMAFARGRVTGSRSCVTPVSTQRLTLSGRYDARRLMLNYNIEQDAEGPERGGGAGWNPARQIGYRWQVTATREGECPLRERRDQLNVNEVVSALFSENGVVD